jgi:hypothetical protein
MRAEHGAEMSSYASHRDAKAPGRAAGGRTADQPPPKQMLMAETFDTAGINLCCVTTASVLCTFDNLSRYFVAHCFADWMAKQLVILRKLSVLLSKFLPCFIVNLKQIFHDFILNGNPIPTNKIFDFHFPAEIMISL